MHKKEKVLFIQVVEEWLETKKIEVKQTTYERYVCITNVLTKYFDLKEMADLTNGDFDIFISDMLINGWSSTSLMMATGILKHIITLAVQRNYIKPIDCKFPKIKKRSKQVKALTATESKKLNKRLCDSNYSGDIAILIALNTGLRIGEICSLRWKDIDLNRHRLTVNGTVHRVKSNDGRTQTKLTLLTPKTAASVREIPIPGFLCNILKEKKTENDFYVLTGTEKIPEPRSIQCRFKKLCIEELGININFHCLRHTFATLAISKGIDEKTVCELLGHSSVTTTLSIYRGVNFDDKAHVVRTLEKYIGPKSK